jgi:hypothetical protein
MSIEYVKKDDVLNMLNRFFKDLEGNEAQVLVSDIKQAVLELPTTNGIDEPGSCKGCKHIGFRYPYASMYPCNNCRRANSKDYYNVDLKED